MFSLFLLLILLVGLGWTAYYRKHWHEQLQISLQFEEEHVHAGEQAHLTEVIENYKKLPVPVLEVRFHTRKELDFHTAENTAVSDYIYKSDVFSVLGRQKISRRLTLDCRKRGMYPIEEVSMTTYSTLFQKRYFRDISSDAILYVYPKRTNVSDVLVTCEKMIGTIQCAKHLYEDPFAFRSIREYTLTDPMKTINWKASAKSGDLMVNTFDSAISSKVMIYLDVEDSGILRQEELVEESISVAATLARKLLQSGMEVGLAMNVEVLQGKALVRDAGDVQSTEKLQDGLRQRESYFRLESQNSKVQLHMMEKALAVYQAEQIQNTSKKDFQILGKSMAYEKILVDAPKDAVLIFISKNAVYKENYIKKFVAEGRVDVADYKGNTSKQIDNMGIWVLPVYTNETVNVKTRGNLRLMIREVDRN